MLNKWNDSEAANLVQSLAPVPEDLAIRTYSARLLGSEPALVLHGGGNTSVKTIWRDRFGAVQEAIAVKASGFDMATIPPSGHALLLLQPARRLLAIDGLSDQEMAEELRGCLVDRRAANPSIETLMHSVIPHRFVDHTHADAILTLTNQRDAEGLVKKALGAEVACIPYVKAGFELARAVNRALAQNPGCEALVLMQHGIVTWGETARESYTKMIDLVTRAEAFLAERSSSRVSVAPDESARAARERYVEIAPVVRGRLALPSGDEDRPFKRVVLRPLLTPEALGLLGAEGAEDLLVSPPLTPDHLIRTKPLPLWLALPPDADSAGLAEKVGAELADYARRYDAYFERHSHRLGAGLSRFDSAPRVLLIPGIGVVCAGESARAADVARDIMEHTLAAKSWFAATGCPYLGLSEEHLFDMEYLPQQHAKLAGAPTARLGREVALVTGAAGAIGLGICEKLLEEGCHVAVTDLPGAGLNAAKDELEPLYPGRVLPVGLDVTDAASVKQGFQRAIEEWGGVDFVVVNAGIAMVSALADMDLEAFRRLERVNIEGTLLILSEAARHFRLQNTGGDVVLVSTKNVFAPGAKFGAYSATKAASHQLARIASLELAEIGVRVNMVAPDAVFSHGARRSGLWAEVGPDRMKARGLDEKGLEQYYQSRNLLKARVTADHVGRAVLYFLTRQTPTTGATIPVDGGLPDSTPR